MEAIVRRALCDIENLEIREGDDVTITGYAAVFEKKSHMIGGMFREKIRKGAFSRSISSGGNIIALWNHNTDLVIGSTRSSSLFLEEDDRGLKFSLTPAQTTAGRDAIEVIKRGDVANMSFGFIIRNQEWDESDPKNIIRTLIDVDLREVSPTAFPAYPQTNVGVRSISDEYQEYLDSKIALDGTKTMLLRRKAFAL